MAIQETRQLPPKFIEELGDQWRKAGCVLGKNGKHIGIFYAAGKSGEEVRFFIEFEREIILN